MDSYTFPVNYSFSALTNNPQVWRRLLAVLSGTYRRTKGNFSITQFIGSIDLLLITECANLRPLSYSHCVFVKLTSAASLGRRFLACCLGVAHAHRTLPGS